ncbi:transcriptional regulator, DeoR family [Pseudooceanicola antarcticus]|nr:DeoR/GlpR family DNA-binding transcription regulator [Pseudooceanicola antarcticus]SNY59321.1 transcriptional regulator, DeoR family [Pseudooceanicola antarcticus]
MIRAERHDRILAELARRGTVSAQELSKLLDASLATIRRDIAELESRKTVTRTHGGASLPQGREELPFDAKVMSYLPEKRRIGAAVASALQDGMTVGVGGGTTVMQMIPAIQRRSLTVVTTAINVALDLCTADDIEVTLTGGTLRRRTAETVGHIAERTLRDINLDVTVIGVDGIDREKGLTTQDSNEAYVNRVMAEQAREVWIMADHSKFGEVRPAKIMPLTGASRIFTDIGLPEEVAARYRALGIEVVRV